MLFAQSDSFHGVFIWQVNAMNDVEVLDFKVGTVVFESQVEVVELAVHRFSNCMLSVPAEHRVTHVG